MRTPLAFLRFVAKSALNAVGGGVAGDFAVEFLPDMARDVWDWWRRGRKPEEMRAELQQLAQAPAEEIRVAIAAVAAEAAADRPPEVQKALSIYLEQIPGVIRQSLRRPADPGGQTVPAGLEFDRPENLLRFLPARLPRFKPGDRPPGVGDWELVELLGVGGFGEVWKAVNPHVPSAAPVALKFCLDGVAARVLRNEAAILDRVMRHGRHPGIVELRHTYLNCDPPCLEYEYVEGGDLSGVIRSWHGNVGPSLAASGVNPVLGHATRLLRDLAGVVAFAHGKGIVHRDLKPANVLVQRGPDGRLAVRVADFGIGAVAARRALTASRGQSGRETAFLATAVRGSHTPLYASPQQMRGDDADPRDDVHALGVLWYQMLTGDLSAGRPGGTRWSRRLAEQGMADKLLDLLSSCFEDEPSDRPADAAALAAGLEANLPPALRGKAAEETGLARNVNNLAATGERGGEPTTVTVSRLGRGDFTSIAAAVRDAAPGTRVVVQPGLYNEGLVLDRPVEIVGEGGGEVIVQNAEGSCLRMATDYAVVRNVTFRCLAGTTGKRFYAVDVPRGQLVLEQCRVTSDSLGCVGVHGPGADPVLRRCTIHDGNEVGLFFSDKARGTVEDCDVYGNALAGVEIKQGAAPLIRRCKVHDGKTGGVLISERAAGVVEDCDVYGNALAGVEVKDGATPLIRRCKIHHGKTGGLYVWGDAAGRIEDCDIFANGLAGVEMKQGACPTMRRCRVSDNVNTGFSLYDQAGPVIEDCDIFGNGMAGVESKQGARPILHRCKIHDGRTSGLYVWEGGFATAEDCDIAGNKLAGVAIAHGGNPTLRLCQIRDGQEGGVMVWEKGTGLLEDCRIVNNALTAVEIKEHGRLTARRCRMTGHAFQALYVHKNGGGVIEYCDLTGNKQGAWFIEAGCVVTRTGNKE